MLRTLSVLAAASALSMGAVSAGALSAGAVVGRAREGVPSVTVRTPLGDVQGWTNGEAQLFQGIPYAKPPVGSLRWQSPVPVAAWAPATLAAQADGPGCPQDCELPPHTCPPVQSEDCLTLNVFAPATARSSDARPVMVFFHGGNFKQGYGGGLLYDGTFIVNTTGVVVVTANYRLGALGFLYSGGGSINGMYGIQDQQEVLRWVQTNIASFGGNPGAVTIFGQSAGAMSIATHFNLDSSKNLFHQGILISDPFTLPFRTPAEFASLASVLGTKAGCAETSGPALDACLRALPWDQLVTAQAAAEVDILADLSHILEVFLPWTPLVDPTRAVNGSLSAQPLSLFVAGQAQDKPIVMGTVQDEAIIFIYEAFTKPVNWLEYVLIADAVFGGDSANKIFNYLPLPAAQNNDTRNHLALVGTDALFLCSTRHAVLGNSSASKPALPRTSPTYVYKFDHVMSFAVAGWGPNFTICYDYVCHGGDLPFVWHPNATAFNLTYTADEEVLSRSIITYYTNFAKTGSPNKDSTGKPTALTWPVFDLASESTMRFTTPSNIVQSHNVTALCEWFDTQIGYDYS